MQARVYMICRTNGKLYLDVRLSGEERLDGLSAYAMAENKRFPAQVFPTADGADSATRWVVTIPFLAFDHADVVIEGSRGAYPALHVNFKRAKLLSLLNARLRRGAFGSVVACEGNAIGIATQMRLLRFLEGEDDTAIWRMDVTEGAHGDNEDEIEVFDGFGNPVEFELFLFEDQAVDMDGIKARRRVYSLRVPYGLDCFYATAGDGFCSCDGRFYNVKRAETRDFMKDACADEEQYRKWLNTHKASPEDLAAQAQAVLTVQPKFSIVVPVFEPNAGYLSACISSVVRQSYANWELLVVDASPHDGIAARCLEPMGDERIVYLRLERNLGIAGNTNVGIENATGDWVAFLDYDDILEPDALFCYARAIARDADAAAMFCDEDTFEVDGQYRFPVFKSELNLDLLYSYNCVTHFLAVKREALEAIGTSPDDVTGAQDYDLTLRVIAAGGKIVHVPRVLYHWRQHSTSTAGDNVSSKPYAQEAGRLALQRHFEARGIAGHVEETSHPFIYRMRYALPDPHPLVSVIIPNKDHIGELDACVRSIIEKSAYREFEIVIVENNSEDDETFAYYERITAEFDQVKVVRWEGSFNYSAIINHGVRHAAGSRLLLLNNDTEIISPDFIPEMLGYLERPEVGVVGAKLFFRDGLVQHAGIEVGPFDTIVHVNQDFVDEREGYRGRATRPGNFSAVTGACQMVRRDVFEQAGGYDEDFAVGFNDADFCMRAKEAGYLTVFTPYAKLHHYEFTSRGREEVDDAKMRRWEGERELFQERWAKYFEEGDPFSNPNLSLESCYYALP